MKTKLLKKVRERYSITKVESLGSHPSELLKDYAEHLGLPFYYLEDERKCTRFLGIKTFDTTYACLKKWILEDYSPQFRHKPVERKKVWYKKP